MIQFFQSVLNILESIWHFISGTIEFFIEYIKIIPHIYGYIVPFWVSIPAIILIALEIVIAVKLLKAVLSVGSWFIGK